MRILQVAHGFPPYNIAGTEVYTYSLSRELAKRHKVFIFHRVKDAQRKEYEIIRSEGDGLEIYALNNTFKYCSSFEQIYKNEAIAKVFANVLDSVRPDIVHIQHLLFLSTTIIEKIKKRGLPIVFTLHDYYLICPRGQLLKNDLTVCNGPSVSGCGDCLFTELSIKRGILRLYEIFYKKAPFALMQLLKKIYLYGAKKFLFNDKSARQIKARAEHFKNLCNMVEVFIAPSVFLKNRFITFGIPKTKMVFSRCGLNLNLLKSINKDRLPPKLRFGFLGTLLPNKGVHLLIKAFSRVKQTGAKLKIYGKLTVYKGFENYLGYIRKLAQNKNIRFMGEYPNESIVEILAEIDVLVVPSVWCENSPRVIQEAFAAKTPVIASKIGGIPELIEDGVNGLLFQPNDINDLYRKINSIIENPFLIEKIKQSINSPKSIRQNANEIESIYKDLLSDAKVF